MTTEPPSLSADALHANGGRTSHLREMVVVHRTAELQQLEAALGLALVCLVAGTRPEISTGMVGEYLMHYYGLDPANFSVRRHDPEDFIVRFTHQHELETVLQTEVPDPPIPSDLESLETHVSRRGWILSVQGACGDAPAPTSCALVGGGSDHPWDCVRTPGDSSALNCTCG